MIKAFISHSSKDKPFVRKLKEDLNFNGVETWLDEDELTPGDRLYDTLILALQSSSHFLIVLSNNIKSSQWIDTEINEAISSLDKKIIKKIIPVLFRKTEIPQSLTGLVYADFSDILFVLKDETVSFTGDRYHIELQRIINALKLNTDYTLSPTEKNDIVEKSKTPAAENKQLKKVVGLYEIIGFASNESRNAYILSVQKKFKTGPLKNLQVRNVIPVVLPSLLKPLFGKIEMGDKIFFQIGNNKYVAGHFCGYSNNNSKIILPSEIRKAFGLRSKVILNIGIDGTKREITFYR